MSDSTEKLRALILALLMVGSVIAPAVALSGSVAAAPPSGVSSDDTPQTVVSPESNEVKIADVTLTTAGNVSNVTVNAAGGTSSVNLPANAIDRVRVELRNTTSGTLLEEKQVDYNAHGETVKFLNDTENVTGVDRVVIRADIATGADGTPDPEIDTAFAWSDAAPANVTFGPYDTANTQVINSSANGDLTGQVRNTRTQEGIQNAEVTAIRQSDGLTKSTVSASDGGYVLQLPAGNYTVRANKTGFTLRQPKDPEVVTNKTTTADLLLEPDAFPDLRVVDVRPASAQAPADGQSLIAIEVNLTDTRTNQPIGGAQINASNYTSSTVLFDSPSPPSSGVFDGKGSWADTNTTLSDGTTTFYVKSDQAQTTEILFAYDENATARATQVVTFGVLSGQGAIPGEVRADTNGPERYGLEDATVWTVTSDRYRQNTLWVQTDFNSAGLDPTTDTAYFRVVDNDTGEILDRDEYEVEVGPEVDLSRESEPQSHQANTTVWKASEIPIGALFIDIDGDGTNDVSELDADTVAEALAEYGEPFDEDFKDRLLQWEFKQQVGKMERLNETNQSVGEGFFARDRNGNNVTAFFVTPLEPGNYTVQVSSRQTNASREASAGTGPDDPFLNISSTNPSTGGCCYVGTGYSTKVATNVSENLTSDRAAKDSDPNTGPQLVDQTNYEGDYLVSKLYTDGQKGEHYTVIAEKAGYDRDWADVLVQEDGHRYEDQPDEVLVLDPDDVTPVVDIYNIALLPNTSAVSPSEDPSDYSQYYYANQSDNFSQTIPRDGEVVDVLVVNTTAERNGAPINDTVTVSVPDDHLNSTDANATNFNGTWIAANPSKVVDRDDVNNTITVYTGSSGQTILWLVSDFSEDDLRLQDREARGDEPICRFRTETVDDTRFFVPVFEGITAVSTTDAGATDATCKDFRGVTAFKQASVSGILTDDTGARVDDTVTYVSSFRYNIDTFFFGTNVRAATSIIFITPAQAANSSTGLPEERVTADMVDDPSDKFHVVQYDWNGATSSIAGSPSNRSEYAAARLGSEFNVTRQELLTYTFPSVGTNLDGQGFPLIRNQGGTEYKLVEDNPKGDSEYTFRPVPAVGSAAGSDTTAYNVRGVGRRAAPIDYRDELGNASTNVKPGFTGTANVAFGFELGDITVSNLQAPSSAVAGETITVSADIQNNGDLDRNLTPEFRLGGQTIATQNVTVSGNSVQTVTFQIDTTGVAAGTYTHGVFVPNEDNETASITIEEQANFEVSNLQAPAMATAGDNITVTADITNTGTLSGTQDVEFQFAGTTLQSQSVTLSGGASQQVTFTVDTTGVAPGTYTHGVFTDNDSETASIDIKAAQQPPFFEIDDVNAANVSQGETLNVTANITNTGPGNGTQAIQVVINGTNVSAGAGKVDIVFLIDTSGSMSDEIQGVTDGIRDFAQTLDSEGIDARYAIITFATGFGGDRYDVRQNYTSSVSQTEQTLNNISTSGAVEYNFDALDGAIDDLNERSDATEFFIDFTDEDSDIESDSPTRTDLANRMSSEGIQYFAVSPGSSDVANASLSKQQLANDTANGVWFDIAEGNFSAKFRNEIAGEVANRTSGQQLSLNSGESGSVTFNLGTSNLAPGTYEGTVSTDNDTENFTVTIGQGQSGPSQLPGGQGAPTDSDGDGLYEDVNGDGTADAVDVTFMLDLVLDSSVSLDPQYFDFNGDGSVNAADVTALLDEVL